MNDEILERLMIDRACGELAPDVAALLDAYTRHEPELMAEAAQIEETLRLARQALPQPRKTALPPLNFDAESLAMLGEARQPRRLPNWAYGLAACFAGGLVLGLLVFPANHPPAAPQASLDRSGPAIAKIAPTQPGFWSIQNLRAINQAPPSGAGDRVIWKSPVRKPEILPAL